MLARLLAVPVVVLSGCHLLELRKQNKAEAEAIDGAYTSRDAIALERWSQTAHNTSSRDKARREFLDVRMHDLLSFDCETFSASFGWITTHDDRGATHSELDPRSGFGGAMSTLTPEERDGFMRQVATKAARCKSATLFSTEIRKVVPSEGGNRRWIELLVDLEKHGEPVFPGFVEMLRHATSTTSFEMATALGWLMRSHSADDCRELESAARSTDINTHAMLIIFYASKGCRAEGVNVAKTLISSSTPLYRARACQALRVLGDSSLVPQMRLLATSDTARDLQQEDIGMWRIAYLTHPVRESCQEALNELELKSMAHGT